MSDASQASPKRPQVPRRLGTFNASPRMLPICANAAPIGGLAAFVADALQMLIGQITNLVFYQRVELALVAPGASPHAWWLVIAALGVGGLIVGVMARHGVEAIRGHDMPEAIEAIEAIRRGGSTAYVRSTLASQP